jgi:glycerol-3-phosphate dehydrogenase (NAD(P)+)
VRSAREALNLSQKRKVEMPVTEAVVAVLEGQLKPGAAVERLLARDPKREG